MNPSLSPEKYIKSRARTLKIDRCLVNANWESGKIAHVIIIRKHTNGNFTYAGYLVDLLCLGVKDTFYGFNQEQEQLDDLLHLHIREMEMIEVEYHLAHNIIFAGNDLAVEFHIPQHPDFISITSFLLEEDDENIPIIEIHTGDENGLPHLVVHPDNRQALALARLQEYAGEGGYRYTVMEENYLPADDNDPEDEWEEAEINLEKWSKEDWERFIKKISKDNYHQSAIEISYIFYYAETKPGLAKRGLDFDKMYKEAGKGVDWNGTEMKNLWIKSNEEQWELNKLKDQIFGWENSTTELTKVINTIQKNIEKWPHNPVFRNYLYNTYLLLEDHVSAEAEMHDTLKLFPDYLAGKTVYIEWLIMTNRFQEVPSVLNSKQYLWEYFADRNVFQVDEFVFFNSAWLYYYLYKEDFYMMDFYARLLENLPDEILGELQRKLLGYVITRRALNVLDMVAIAQNDPTEMDKLTMLLVSK